MSDFASIRIVPIGMALGTLLAVSFLLCVVFGLVFPGATMYQAWLPLLPGVPEMGATPETTALYVEGCADVTPPALLEAWARHTLNWVTRWDADGPRALHAEWRGLVHGIGEEITLCGQSGSFLGADEDFGALLRQGDETRLIPLTALLEEAP